MKKPYHVVSFSGGKDSTAMLLHMLELGMPVDEVVNVDTGFELDAQQCRPHFISTYSLAQLEARFALEEERLAQGLTISARNKEFKAALAERLQRLADKEREKTQKM